MKITEQTTLAELDSVLASLGHPFVTVMKTHPSAPYARQAIAYLPGIGAFNGSGSTHAEAIEDALTSLSDALNNFVRDKAARLEAAVPGILSKLKS